MINLLKSWLPIHGQVITDVPVEKMGIDTCIDDVQPVKGHGKYYQQVAVAPVVILSLDEAVLQPFDHGRVGQVVVLDVLQVHE